MGNFTDICRINPNDGMASDMKSFEGLPLTISFFAAGSTPKAARFKMAKIVKELKRGGYATRYKSWKGGPDRFYVIATDAPAETARQAVLISLCRSKSICVRATSACGTHGNASTQACGTTRPGGDPCRG